MFQRGLEKQNELVKGLAKDSVSTYKEKAKLSLLLN